MGAGNLSKEPGMHRLRSRNFPLVKAAKGRSWKWAIKISIRKTEDFFKGWSLFFWTDQKSLPSSTYRDTHLRRLADVVQKEIRGSTDSSQ